jgi:hypothetical protein
VYAYLRADHTPYYIGKGSGKRAWSKGSKEIGLTTDLTKIVILIDNIDEPTAFEYERKLISLFGRKDIGTGILRNKSAGGEGNIGWKATDDQRTNHYMKRPEWRAIQSGRSSGASNPCHGIRRFGEDNPAYGVPRSESWKESMRGENNPINNPEHQKTCEVCNKTMPKNVFSIWGHGPHCGTDNSRKTLLSERVSGTNNPMYGREPHNKMTNITTPLGLFCSVKDAALAHKVVAGTILYRIKSTGDKFKEYHSDN